MRKSPDSYIYTVFHPWHTVETQVLIDCWLYFRFEISPAVLSSFRNWERSSEENGLGTNTDLLLFLPEKILQELDLCFCSSQVPGGSCCLSAEPLNFLQLLLGQSMRRPSQVVIFILLSLRLILFLSHCLPGCPMNMWCQTPLSLMLFPLLGSLLHSGLVVRVLH